MLTTFGDWWRSALSDLLVIVEGIGVLVASLTPEQAAIAAAVIGVVGGGFAVVTGLVAPAVIYLGVIRTIRQKDRSDAQSLRQKQDADARTQWWLRVQWAMDHVLLGEGDAVSTRQEVGIAALERQATSSEGSAADVEFLDGLYDGLIGASLEGFGDDVDTPREEVRRPLVWVAAAGVVGAMVGVATARGRRRHGR